MLLVKKVSFKEVKDIINNSKFINYPGPFRDMEYFKYVKSGYTEKQIFHKFKFINLNYVLFDNEQPIILVLLIKNIFNKDVFFRGEFNSNFSDFIYFDYNIENLKFLVDFIKVDNPKSRIHINRIIENSFTYNYLIKYNGEPINSELCGKIDNIKNYEDWTSRLSKSFKQNLRTAYNKLNKNNRFLLLKVYQNESIPIFIKLQILYLFSKRLLQHSNLQLIFIPFILFLKFLNPFTQYLFHNSRKFHFVLFINDKPVGFVSCLKYGHNYYIPRLSVNLSFSQYSPGLLLISELIKTLSKQEDFFTVDLTRGGEKYKFDYGATRYLVYDWIL